MRRTAQSVHDKQSINASEKKLKEFGLYKPVAKWQWEEKKEMFERLQPILAQRFVPKTEAERKQRNFCTNAGRRPQALERRRTGP